MANILNNTNNELPNNDQSPYNNTNSNITNTIVVPIAFLSNSDVSRLDNIDNIDFVAIELGNIPLTFSEFILMFYNNSGLNFNINQANSSSFAVSFLNQFYNTTTNDKNHFSLYDQFLKAWSKKNNKAQSTLDFIKLIQFQREIFLFKSLTDLTYIKAVSLDEIFSILISSGKIKPVNVIKNNNMNEYNNGAQINFKIESLLKSSVLDINLKVFFNYSVKIHGFQIGDLQQVFPTKPNTQQLQLQRAYLDDDDDDFTLKTEELPHVKNNNFYEYSINNNIVPKKDNMEENSVFSEISKIVNNNIKFMDGEQNSIGNESEKISKW
jgi:hypothetical protein